jgi:hypothetical protein
MLVLYCCIPVLKSLRFYMVLSLFLALLLLYHIIYHYEFPFYAAAFTILVNTDLTRDKPPPPPPLVAVL